MSVTTLEQDHQKNEIDYSNYRQVVPLSIRDAEWDELGNVLKRTYTFGGTGEGAGFSITQKYVADEQAPSVIRGKGKESNSFVVTGAGSEASIASTTSGVAIRSEVAVQTVLAQHPDTVITVSEAQEGVVENGGTLRILKKAETVRATNGNLEIGNKTRIGFVQAAEVTNITTPSLLDGSGRYSDARQLIHTLQSDGNTLLNGYRTAGWKRQEPQLITFPKPQDRPLPLSRAIAALNNGRRGK